MYDYERTHRRKRRGMTYIEVVASMMIVVLLTSTTLATVSVMSKSIKQASDYTTIKIYGVKKLEEIKNDLELSIDYRANPIDTVDYSEVDPDSGIVANVEVESVGMAFNKDLYLVTMILHKEGLREIVKSQTLLRGGCVAKDD